MSMSDDARMSRHARQFHALPSEACTIRLRACEDDEGLLVELCRESVVVVWV